MLNLSGTGFLEFRPSEIAAAVAATVAGEATGVVEEDIAEAFTHVDKVQIDANPHVNSSS
jgi:hypothetical protein